VRHHPLGATKEETLGQARRLTVWPVTLFWHLDYRQGYDLIIFVAPRELQEEGFE
jgi:hypothetical protein